MKFLIDAQLPRRLIYRLQEVGHEAIHTLDLPLGNRSPDQGINEISELEQRVVVTKDADKDKREKCFWISDRLTLRPTML